MEELLELQSEEVKLSMEKNKKRRLKTPAQVMALEKFYNDHKYPTEEMKSTLADELELTEKQVSGWFCHRRLKDKRLLNDEVGANGRQDRSSGVIQDRGSGLGQDSCGSTKHCDYRFLDPKEVESRDIYNTEFSAVDMTYGQRTHYPEDDSATDNKSFESSLSLQEWFPQEQDPYDMGPSRFPIPSGPLPPPNPKVAKNMGNKPSGYLKVKGEMEHAAITSVKKQLGKHYRENGPLLTVEFDTIPLGAFECHIADPANEPNNVANPIYPNSPDISALKRLSDLSSRYDSYFTKLSSQDSHVEGGDFGSLLDSDFQDEKPCQHINQRSTFHSFTNHLPRRNSSLDLYVDSAGEACAFNSSKNHRMGTKHGLEWIRSDSASNPSDQYEENNLVVKQRDSLLHGYDNSNLKNMKRSEYVKAKPSNLMHKSRIFMNIEKRQPSKRMTKEEKFKGDRKVKKQNHDSDAVRTLSNEMMVTKRAKVDLLQHYDVQEAPVAEMEPRKSQRYTAEMPYSISEDETAETGSSID
ncbi:homeobox-DDT domain protein RLT1-like isoform X2 [Abrus precatorius]|uniref:Homeobox-DDT domain protein RLT1-like isoform X2 n=1 Tax=Abrus precatorius TaxID=3816 RepID=A0A8B8KKF9_ABRPR|nr:homeobox-DDT domain protein RLT1-like isoform X2 [Abrus precatorius]